MQAIFWIAVIVIIAAFYGKLVNIAGELRRIREHLVENRNGTGEELLQSLSLAADQISSKMSSRIERLEGLGKTAVQIECAVSQIETSLESLSYTADEILMRIPEPLPLTNDEIELSLLP